MIWNIISGTLIGLNLASEFAVMYSAHDNVKMKVSTLCAN